MYLGVKCCSLMPYIVIINYSLHGRWQPREFLLWHHCITYFVVLRMLRSSRAYVFYKRGLLQNVAKFTEESNKILRKLLRTIFLQNTSKRLLLNAGNSKNPHNCWSKTSFFSPLSFLVLSDSILMDLLIGCRNLELRNSLEFSETFCSVINDLFFMFAQCWKGCKSFVNICYLHNFFHVRFMSFWPLMK